MGDSAVAAFDPAFWLHHTNVDRLLAMWQAVNPHSYVTPFTNAYGTFGEAKGTLETEDTNLLPFHANAEGTFWTSKGVRSTRTFGYTYPELVDWNRTPEELASSVRSIVNRLYNPVRINNIDQLKSLATSPKLKPAKVKVGGLQGLESRPGKSGIQRQWTIKVEVQRFAYTGSFAIDFFLGTPPSSPVAWPTASNLVGSYAQFITTDSNLMQRAMSPDTLSYGEVSLTRYLSSLVQRGVLADLEPHSVTPSLLESLTWRARDIEGCEVKLDSLTSLKIAVGSRAFRGPITLDEFPSFGGLEIFENITAGKPGGLGPAWNDKYY
jgi:tyrosinase